MPGGSELKLRPVGPQVQRIQLCKMASVLSQHVQATQWAAVPSHYKAVTGVQTAALPLPQTSLTSHEQGFSVGTWKPSPAPGSQGVVPG